MSALEHYALVRRVAELEEQLTTLAIALRSIQGDVAALQVKPEIRQTVSLGAHIRKPVAA